RSPPPASVARLTTPGTAAAPRLTTSPKLVLSPTAIGSLVVAVTTGPEVENDQPPPTPETNPTPAGSVSVTVSAPTDGPLLTLVTTKVQAPSWPCRKAAVWRLSSARSGWRWMVVG